MMTKKMFTISLLALGACTAVMAAEYNEPDVNFKEHQIPSKVMKVSEFGDHYAMEKAENENDRQIASKDEEEATTDDAPKPWQFRTEGKKAP